MIRSLSALLVLLAAAAWSADIKEGVAARNITTVKFQRESLGQERFFNILLHGFGQGGASWSYMTNLSGYATHYKLIIVMPDASNSWYVNAAADTKARFEDFIVKDLIAYIDAHYRTVPLPRARAVAGLSMGGYGAAFLGLKHYRLFSAMGTFSGALTAAHDVPGEHDTERQCEFEQEIRPLFGAPGSPERRQRDPFALVEEVPPAQMPLIYIACGGQDGLVRENREFVRLLAEKKIPYEYREVSPRSHTWDFWDDQARVFPDLLDKRAGFGE